MKCEFCNKEFDEWKVEIVDINELDERRSCPYCGAPDTFRAEEYARELEREAMWPTQKEMLK